MKWITREKIKVDRVACPWLIRKFIDRDAEFVFLPRDTDWAKINGGIAFEVPNCELGKDLMRAVKDSGDDCVPEPSCHETGV